MRRLSRILLGGVTFVALLLPAGAIAKPGDLYVGDPSIDSEPGEIVKVNHRNGHQAVVASGGHLDSPDSGAFAGPHKLFIADYGAFAAGNGAVFQINPGTGGVQTIAKNSPFHGPTDLAIAPNGSLYTVDPFAGTDGTGAIFKVNPQTGSRPIISQAQLFNGGPLGIVVLPSGKLLTTDQDAGPSDSGALLKVNPVSGNQSFVASGGHLDDPYGLTLAGNGKTAFVVDSEDNELVRVKIANGDQRVIAGLGGANRFASDVTLGLDGKLYAISYSDTVADVFQINRRTGQKRVFATGGHLDIPEGITVQPHG
jgi:hypothetical protein